MTITIGRYLKNSRLKLVCEGKTYLYGLPNSVPESVSPSHILLECENEMFRVKNLDINNFTYVEGRGVESKNISRGDRIELGQDHYVVDWKAIDEVIPPVADIRPLKKVWNDFDAHRLDQQIADRSSKCMVRTSICDCRSCLGGFYHKSIQRRIGHSCENERAEPTVSKEICLP